MLSSVLTDLLHIAKILCIFIYFFSLSYRDGCCIRNKVVVSVVTTVFMSIVMFCFFNPMVDLIVYILFAFLLTMFWFEEKVVKILILLLWTLFLVTMLDNISKVLVNNIINYVNFTYDNVDSLFASCISFIYVLIMSYIYKRKFRIEIKNIEYKYLIVFLILAIADAFVITFLSDKIGKDSNIYVTLSLCIVVVGIFLQLAFVIMLFIQRNIYKEQKQNVETYLKAQKSHYEYLEKKEHETKKFRHDLQSHMKLMSKFIEENNYEEFKRYYEKINDKIESFKSQVTVYNGIADAIINQYYSIATSKGIDMKVSGRFPVDCDIDTYDLCTIFSNILSNAVEAAERAAEKRIKLECKYSDNKELFIFLNNTYKDIGIIESKKIRTRKNNSDYHGYGMENVEDSVKKYKGSYYYEIEDNEFKVTILLNY